jgi:hypothetical protein
MGERRVAQGRERRRGPCCGLPRAPVAAMQAEGAGARQPLRAVLGYPQPLPLNFFPLYHFSPLFFPLFFHLPQRFPLNTPRYPTTTIKYHFLYQLSIFYLLTITRGSTTQCLRLSAAVPSKFFPYIIFLRHIINISFPMFSSPAAVLPILSPYTPLQL